jgi:photosystem I reaction center subunit XII
MGLSDTQVLVALVVALFPAVMAFMLGSALSNS